MLGLEGISEFKHDLEYLLRKEQHLKRAYRELLEHVQQHARESAVETPEIAVPKVEVLTTGHSSASLCPAPIASSGFHGQEMVNLYPQTPIPETGDLIDFSVEEEPPSEPTAEERASRHSAADLCLEQLVTQEDVCKATDFSDYFPAEQLAGVRSSLLSSGDERGCAQRRRPRSSPR